MKTIKMTRQKEQVIIPVSEKKYYEDIGFSVPEKKKTSKSKTDKKVNATKKKSSKKSNNGG